MKPKLFNGTEWIEFETQKDHDEYIASITPPPQTDYGAIVDQRIATGKQIIREYLADNAAINLTFNQSVEQLQKFQVVKAFLEVGNLEDAKVLIQQTATDGVFTEVRKDRYLSMFP